MSEKVTLSTGVVLELSPPSPWAFMAAQRKIQADKPKPPLYLNEEKGREEENEGDPAYVAALSLWEKELIEYLYDVGIATGTRVIESPIPTSDSEELDDLLEVLRITPATGKKARYLQWLKYWAAPTSKDIQVILEPLLRMMGTPEADVAQATELFRGDEGRPTDNGNRAQRRHPERHPVRVPASGAGASV